MQCMRERRVNIILKFLWVIGIMKLTQFIWEIVVGTNSKVTDMLNL